jgi:hypothetical protein
MDQPICFNGRHEPSGALLSPHRRPGVTPMSRDDRVGVTLAARLRVKPPRFSMINGVNLATMT